MGKQKRFATIVLTVFLFGCIAQNTNVSAQTNQSESYAPSIGVAAVPAPSSLPRGAGDVTYKYAVKNFSKEIPLLDIKLTDDTCSPIKFIEGDDNHDSRLDFKETWRYTCKTKIYATTQNVARVTAVYHAGDADAEVTVSHKSYSTVLVGSYAPPPIVSIVNISKVAFPYSLPAGGGDIVFIYRINNPGDVPLSNVRVTDSICDEISSKLGDRNNNGLLDLTEVWMYTCTAHIDKTTTNTAHVSASGNGLYAIGEATFTVQVDPSPEKNIAQKLKDDQTPARLPDAGKEDTSKGVLWGILAGISLTLGITFLMINRKNLKRQ